GTGKAVEDEIARAAEYSGAQSVDLRVHPHALVAVDPTSRLHVDLLAGGENFLEDVAVAVQPHHALRLCRGKAVHEEPGRAEKHVPDSLLAGEAVLQIARCRKVLVFTHLNGGAGAQMQREHVPGTVAGKRDPPRPARLGQKDLHAGDGALERTLALD